MPASIINRGVINVEIGNSVPLRFPYIALAIGKTPIINVVIGAPTCLTP